MEVLFPRCAGLDVHKDVVVACAQVAVDGRVTQEVRSFATTTTTLCELSTWLDLARGATLHARGHGSDGSVLEASMACPRGDVRAGARERAATFPGESPTSTTRRGARTSSHMDWFDAASCRQRRSRRSRPLAHPQATRTRGRPAHQPDREGARRHQHQDRERDQRCPRQERAGDPRRACCW